MISKSRRVCIAFALAVTALIGTIGSGPRAEAAGADTARKQEQQTMTLFETEKLYDDRMNEVGAISPQQVSILRRTTFRAGHGEGYRLTKYLIPTWMGDLWIVPNNGLAGSKERHETDVGFGAAVKLYTDPGLTQPSGETFGPGMLRTIAKWGDRIQVKTTQGDRWLSLMNLDVFLGVRTAQGVLTLQEPTALYAFPQGTNLGASLVPQDVRVTKVWRDWYQTDSWLGPVWFRPALTEAEKNKMHIDHLLGPLYEYGQTLQDRGEYIGFQHIVSQWDFYLKAIMNRDMAELERLWESKSYSYKSIADNPADIVKLYHDEVYFYTLQLVAFHHNASDIEIVLSYYSVKTKMQETITYSGSSSNHVLKDSFLDQNKNRSQGE